MLCHCFYITSLLYLGCIVFINVKAAECMNLLKRVETETVLVAKRIPSSSKMSVRASVLKVSTFVVAYSGDKYHQNVQYNTNIRIAQCHTNQGWLVILAENESN
jgi:hypothetical protein